MTVERQRTLGAPLDVILSIAREVALTALLLASLIFVLTVFETRQHPFTKGFVSQAFHFTSTLSVDAHGRPLWPPLTAALEKSLHLAGLSLCFVFVLRIGVRAPSVLWS